MDKQKQIEEAIKRMKMLKLHKNPINEFTKENKLNFSEWLGALYWVDGDENAKKALAMFKEQYPEYVPYHMIHNVFEFGDCWSILYVSTHEDEWAYDNDDLKDGYAMSYVVNLTYPEYSEFGTIGIKPSYGGLVRVA